MQLDDDSFLNRFETRDLGPEHFDHRGHLRMAWLHLDRYGLEEANARVCQGIRDLAIKFNAPEKFSHTLTEASMRIIAARMHGGKTKPFEQFLQHNRDLVADARGVLARHYSAACLDSPTARAAWIEPDLEPIPRPDAHSHTETLR